jgi:S-methylmethionine-dependent homocysteine/selenocysteine methylase
MPFIVLDGALGSQLTERGLDTRPPLWSARALDDAPEVVTEIHRSYAAAGATVHRTNTFRTRPRTLGGDSAESHRLMALAVKLTRSAVPHDHRVAGSLGPLEDCYRPDLAPSDDVCEREHGEFAFALAAEGVDLLFCETFPSPREARIATAACVATGLPTWTSFTAGPNGDLLTPDALAEGALACRDAGAEIVLANCIAAAHVLPYLEALARRELPFGVYANAAVWNGPRATPVQYVEYARTWVATGARVIGSCCGTGPEHTTALHALAAAMR